MYQGLGTVFWLFFGRKKKGRQTPLLELRFKCQIQTKKLRKWGLLCLSLY